MKTIKETAEELIRDFYTWGINKEGQSLSMEESKQLASMTVTKILEARPSFPYAHQVGEKVSGLLANIEFPVKFWKEVKSEIEKP